MPGRFATTQPVFQLEGAAAAADKITRRILRAGRDTISHVTKGLERELEDVTRHAVPGRLWRAWTSETWPKGGRIARNPEGAVWINGSTRSKGAMTFFSRPGRIEGRSGQWLAIPTPEAGSRGRARNLTPGEWERRTGAKLRFVYRRGKASLLVLDQAVLSGKKGIGRLNTARRRAKGRGDSTIIIFFLIPTVAFANKFAIEPVIRKWEAAIGPDFVARARGIG